LFNALSSQLDFVGLHLLESIVLVGLKGKDASELVLSSGAVLIPDGERERDGGNAGLTNPSSVVEVVMLLLIELDVPGRSCVTVVLLWLEVGLEAGS
jgi:hypothetical protein